MICEPVATAAPCCVDDCGLPIDPTSAEWVERVEEARRTVTDWFGSQGIRVTRCIRTFRPCLDCVCRVDCCTCGRGSTFTVPGLWAAKAFTGTVEGVQAGLWVDGAPVAVQPGWLVTWDDNTTTVSLYGSSLNVGGLAQNLTLPHTAPGTWAVKIIDGRTTPPLVARMVAALACAGGCGGKCDLPAGVSSMTSDGVTVQFDTGFPWAGASNMQDVVAGWRVYGTRRRTSFASFPSTTSGVWED